ncbi:Ribonuclease H1 [Yarrowia sp. B02]|nr:Ribonuclease H1 [Yarrowia sp. B02]
MKNYYAVQVVRQPGIYEDYYVARDQIQGFPRARWKGFNSYEDAQEFVSLRNTAIQSKARRSQPRRNIDPTHYVLGGAIFSSLAEAQFGRQAGIGVYFGGCVPENVSARLQDDSQTNQSAELGAIRKAYEIIDAANDGCHYQINTDSEFAINCLTKWADNWAYNGWKNSSGDTVANANMIYEIMMLMRKPSCRNVRLNKVKAHSGCEGNDKADELARRAIDHRKHLEETLILQQVLAL